MKLTTKAAISAALGVALGGGLALNACGSTPPVRSAPAPITAHGQLVTAVSIFDGETPAEALPDISDGGQVTVINSAGVVIGTGVLSETSSARTIAVTDYYAFAVTVPGGLARYGVQVGHDRGTVWESAAEMRSGPSLCLGDGC